MAKRITIYLAGLFVAAFGIALVIMSAVGAGPWDAVAVGLNLHFGLTVGLWSILSLLLFTLLTFLIEKTRFRLESMVPIIIRGAFLDFWLYGVLRGADFASSPALQWTSFAAGLLLIGAGLGAYMEAGFPKTPVDGLMVAVSGRTGWSFSSARMLIEGTGAATAFLLGGPVALGTLLTALFLGKIIQTVNAKTKTILQAQRLHEQRT
ncbi:BCR, YitT family protein [Bhargavaea cecembensis]|uniref:BCR, YitT family protein n=1 Tax=Bhargavaea cecembensis TaxID=394098 RepID=A0A161SME3_9BACL|nr:BCR, YitT family protein [Bhargavaea cecembensis]KZE39023.1 BCR, YitT family protein [Bhargavaea cecembensis]